MTFRLAEVGQEFLRKLWSQLGAAHWDSEPSVLATLPGSVLPSEALLFHTLADLEGRSGPCRLLTFDSTVEGRGGGSNGGKLACWCLLPLEECRSSWNPGLARAAPQGQPARGLAPFPGGGSAPLSSSASFLGTFPSSGTVTRRGEFWPWSARCRLPSLRSCRACVEAFSH